MNYISKELSVAGFIGFISTQAAKLAQFPFVRKSFDFYVQANTSLHGRVSQMAQSSLIKNHLGTLLVGSAVIYLVAKNYFGRKEGVRQRPRVRCEIIIAEDNRKIAQLQANNSDLAEANSSLTESLKISEMRLELLNTNQRDLSQLSAELESKVKENSELKSRSDAQQTLLLDGEKANLSLK